MLLSFYNKNSYYLKSASKLLGSGFITSIGFILLSSNRIPYFDTKLVIDLLIFLQLHTIGLTVSKLGFDSISYASYIDAPNLKPNIKRFIVNKCLPISLLVLIFTAYKFDLFIGIMVLVNVLLDQYSSLVISQLNFRHRFNVTVFLNFLSYPFYFILIILLSSFLNLELYQYVIIFSLNIAFKFFLSYYFYDKIEAKGYNEVNPKWIMGLQQVLNYLLFKGDLVMLSIPVFLTTFLQISENETIEILFLSRFPELVSGVTLSLSVLYYPKFYFKNGAEFIKRFITKAVLLYFIVLLFSIIIYVRFWHHSFELNLINTTFYFFIGFLVVFCNLISFNLIRDNEYGKLIKGLLISVFVGCIYILLCSFFSIKLVFLLVLLQMLVFICSYFAIPSYE